MAYHKRFLIGAIIIGILAFLILLKDYYHLWFSTLVFTLFISLVVIKNKFPRERLIKFLNLSFANFCRKATNRTFNSVNFMTVYLQISFV